MPDQLSGSPQSRYLFFQGLLARDFSPPARVVELGAAPGDQIAALALGGYDATAVDIGIAPDEWAQGESGRMQRLLEHAGVRYLEWDLENWPYPLEDEQYDAVIMTEVFEHLREYPINALRETHRILRPGGRLYFSTPNAAYLRNRLRLLAGHSTATPLMDWVGGLPHARHAREYTFSEIEELMRLAGLRIVFAGSRHFHAAEGSAPKRAAKYVLDRVARTLPTLGPQIIVVAER